MVFCERCKRTVEDLSRTTCPACFAPLPTNSLAIPVIPPLPAGTANAANHTSTGAVYDAPRSPYLPPVASPGYGSQPAQNPPTNVGYAPSASTPPQRPGRIALTGEVVDTSLPPATPGYGPPLPGSAPPPRPGYQPSRLPVSTPIAAPYAPTSNYRNSSGLSSYMKIRLAIAAVGVLIAACSYAAKSIYGATVNGSSTNSASAFPRLPFSSAPNPEARRLQSPESGAQSAMDALHNRDWKTLYYVCAFEPNEQKTDSEEREFVRQLSAVALTNHNPLTIFNLMGAATHFTATGGSIHGTSADVSTSWTIPYVGQTLTVQGTAHMIQQNGCWMLNLIVASGTLDDMLGRVTSQTGSGPSIVFPRFGGFGPHFVPSFQPPIAGATPGGSPFAQNSTANPQMTPNANGPQEMNPGNVPQFPQPRFGTGPRFGPNNYPRGPQFGPRGFSGAVQPPTYSSGTVNGQSSGQAESGSSFGNGTSQFGNGPSPSNGGAGSGPPQGNGTPGGNGGTGGTGG